MGDFFAAGKPEAWGTAYQEVYGKAVVLPEVITETFVLPTPIKEGHTFGGWYWEADFSGTPVAQLEVGASGTLYAKWNKIPETPTKLDILQIGQTQAVKIMQDGRIVILQNNKYYDLRGNHIK